MGILAGCRDSRPQPPKTAVVEADPLDRAREAMARRDYGAAAALLREVLPRRPNDLEVHYRLGVSASQLDAVDEAAREFEWVVAHGDRSAAEVRIAHEWLASRAHPGTSRPVVAAVRPDAPDAPPALATLSGRATGRDGVKGRLRLFLKGVPGTAVQNEYHVLRTDQDGSFRFTNVVPGDYMLTDAVAGPVLWRLRVSLGRAERRTLELSPANAATARDDFPAPR